MQKLTKLLVDMWWYFGGCKPKTLETHLANTWFGHIYGNFLCCKVEVFSVVFSNSDLCVSRSRSGSDCAALPPLLSQSQLTNMNPPPSSSSPSSQRYLGAHYHQRFLPHLLLGSCYCANSDPIYFNHKSYVLLSIPALLSLTFSTFSSMWTPPCACTHANTDATPQTNKAPHPAS